MVLGPQLWVFSLLSEAHGHSSLNPYWSDSKSTGRPAIQAYVWTFGYLWPSADTPVVTLSFPDAPVLAASPVIAVAAEPLGDPLAGFSLPFQPGFQAQ